MSYSPEQVEECADGYDALGEPVGASMLRAYAATLRQQAARVDEEEISASEKCRRIQENRDYWYGVAEEYRQKLCDANAALEAALSAQPAPLSWAQGIGHEGGHYDQPAERQGEAVTDKQVAAAIKTSPELDALIDTESKASIAFAAYRLGLTHPAAPVGVPDESIEENGKWYVLMDGARYEVSQIEAEGWDYCVSYMQKLNAATSPAPQGEG